MKPMTPSFAFVCTLPIGPFVYLVGAPWLLTLVMGVIIPLLMAYMALVSLARDGHLAWDLWGTRSYWLLTFPLVLTILSMACFVVSRLGYYPELFFMAMLGVFGVGTFLMAITGCVVIVSDLMGKIPLKRP
ncbi:hypothetical protein C5Y96_11590 [Blastopirellula marina]|uniref:Uncharacterized protein n=1 Tax=Blastopirellula marina TaxID=124 RepID=A0A2S8FNP7_9BACT|nr:MULTISPECIES: hypothetical protein [Pirellulaceae]PQO33474.1 hypothetical protein C5Y96_11590 [Blastopirellula marina]RCS52565.1 hypothetical protein DTL36_11600 [Bremerella cremea]